WFMSGGRAAVATQSSEPIAALPRHRDFNEFVASSHTKPNTDTKIDRHRASSGHRSTVDPAHPGADSWLGQGAHRSFLHTAFGHGCHAHHAEDLHRLPSRVPEAHGVRIAPADRLRLVGEFRAKLIGVDALRAFQTNFCVG